MSGAAERARRRADARRNWLLSAPALLVLALGVPIGPEDKAKRPDLGSVETLTDFMFLFFLN